MEWRFRTACKSNPGPANLGFGRMNGRSMSCRVQVKSDWVGLVLGNIKDKKSEDVVGFKLNGITGSSGLFEEGLLEVGESRQARRVPQW